MVAGLGIAVYSYRHDRPLSFRSALYPVLGAKHVDRWPGLTVDLIALFGTVCGVATSIGISAGGMNATLGSLLQLDVSIPEPDSHRIRCLHLGNPVRTDRGGTWDPSVE